MTPMRWVYPAFVALFAVWQLGCQPKIGDGCNLSTDCSIRGDRQCDTSQPGGYCTIFQCLGNTCPNGSTCVAVNSEVPGCGYDDRRSPARSTKTFCLSECKADSDCRYGYRCQDVRQPPWNGRPLDDGPFYNVCVVGTPTGDASMTSNSQAPVCKPGGPEYPPISVTDASDEASQDGGSEAGDAGSGEAGDAAAE